MRYYTNMGDDVETSTSEMNTSERNAIIIMICNGRVHTGFGHANMTQGESETSTTYSEDDSLGDINGRQHAGFGHDNMLQAKQTKQTTTDLGTMTAVPKHRLRTAMMIH
jgi:hypothetical protein